MREAHNVCFMHTPTALTGANVRAEISRRGLSQGQVAEAIGVSQSQFSKRLRGVIAFDINELSALAEYLNVPLAELLPKSEPVAS